LIGIKPLRSMLLFQPRLDLIRALGRDLFGDFAGHEFP
jgi:hypothetical protein